MGIYLNPGNSGFAEIINGKYIDKTNLINLINERIDSVDKLVCVSRPRRFGKSYASKMICAYYDHTCDSLALFDGKEISLSNKYEEYINKYSVISLDMASIISDVLESGRKMDEIPSVISERLWREINDDCPGIKNKDSLIDSLVEYVEITGRKFIFVIDEWDAVIREAKNDDKAQKNYLNMLRSWFKNNNVTPKVVAAAYMTGILPIKKDGSQSAISDFKEYTILNPGPFTKYTGFSDDEVKTLCDEYGMDYELMKYWYDGYEFEGFGAVYNPYSVMETIKSGEYESHWQKTSASESLVTYINMDEDGLQADIIKMLSGERLRVNTRGFMNDFETFNSKDDVITLLIHLGYLAYDKKEKTVRVPNNEVKLEFDDIIENPKHTKLAELVRDSEKLLSDTLAGNEEEVARAIEKVRETNYAPQYYNNEQALRYALKFAYIVCIDRFIRIEELPTGRGLADLVFIPDKNTAYPAIIIELKWNKESSEALDQINDKRYDSVLAGYTGEVVKVGISYDDSSKIHSCRIEKKIH